MAEQRKREGYLANLGALWKTSVKGTMSGKIGGVPILLIPNQFKTSDNQPDFNILVNMAGEKPVKKAEDPPVQSYSDDDGDEVPF